MTSQKTTLLDTRIAEVDMTDKQYHLVTFGTGDEDMKPATAGAKILGVSQEKPKQGEHGTVAYDGILKVKLGGTVAPGDSVASNASGRGIAGAAGAWALGFYLNGGVAGDVVRVLADRHKVT